MRRGAFRCCGWRLNSSVSEAFPKRASPTSLSGPASVLPLVIYYFGTRDRLLVDAWKYSEEAFYEAAERMLAEVPLTARTDFAADRVDLHPHRRRRDPGAWGLWFDVGTGLSAMRRSRPAGWNVTPGGAG